MLSVLIVDPQFLTRTGLFHLLDNLDKFSLDMSENAEIPKDAEKYDLIITDYLKPYSSELNPEIWNNIFPALSKKLLVISADSNRQRIREILSQGTPGFLTKDCTPDEILSAIEMISKGNRFYCNKVLEMLSHVEGNDPNDCVPTSLSQRETEILKLIATGSKTTEIADKLYISVHTVNSHRKNILKKLKLTSPTQLVAYAHEIGIV